MDERQISSDSQADLLSSHICSRESLHKPGSESNDRQIICKVGDLVTEELSSTNFCEMGHYFWGLSYFQHQQKMNTFSSVAQEWILSVLS